MKTIITKQINGSNIFIVDNAISHQASKEFYDKFSSLQYNWNAKNFENDKFLTFSAELKQGLVLKSLIGTICQNLLEDLYPNKEYVLFKSRINLLKYGDMSFPHTDCPKIRRDVTILYYVNESWDYRWGGENFFYDKNGATLAVLPKPRRLVIFEGFIKHKAVVPNKSALDNRLTFALKYTLRSQIVESKLQKIHEY